LSEPAFDELLRRLAGAEAQFVVVGGLAVNAWGVVRGTSIGDLKAMKQAAGRTRDLADLEDLDAAGS
jgi:hypothetical protein